MSLKMKVGSYYYNKLAGVLRCHNYASGVYVMVNRNFLYDVDAYGKDCTEYPNAEYDLEYECDVYGNEVYVATQTTPTKVDLELKIDTTDAVLALKELQSELEKVKSIKQQNEQEQRKHNHYFKDVSNLNEIDVYAVLTLFEVTDPCIAHAAKKLLCTGNRGHKDFETDVQDAIDSLVRWKELNRCLNK